MVAATNTRARGRAAMPTVGSGVMALINQPKYEYREVGIGGTREPIMVAGEKIADRWVDQTFMMLRDIPNHPNQLGWWIPEIGKEVVFEYFSLSNIHRAEMIERSDPVYHLLGEWLDLQTEVQAMVMETSSVDKSLADDAKIAAWRLEWQRLREQQAQKTREGIIMFEAVLRVVTISPILVDDKEKEVGGAIWIKRFSVERLLQIWTFLMNDLYRVQDYFRQARG